MQARLDFTYFEYPELAGFERIVLALLRFARGYRDSTGFAPGAFALYFVQRTGHRQRTQLNYGGSAGDKLHCSIMRILRVQQRKKWLQLHRRITCECGTSRPLAICMWHFARHPCSVSRMTQYQQKEGESFLQLVSGKRIPVWRHGAEAHLMSLALPRFNSGILPYCRKKK